MPNHPCHRCVYAAKRALMNLRVERDIPPRAEVCQTSARNGPPASTCTGLLECCLGVSCRSNLALPGTVRVQIIDPLLWVSSTEVLTPACWVGRPIRAVSHLLPLS